MKGIFVAHPAFSKIVLPAWVLCGMLPVMAFYTVILTTEPSAAQQAPPQFIPTDVTPFTVNPEYRSLTPGYKFRIFKALPPKLWIQTSTEVSNRLETNVFQTYNDYKADYVFRVLPNVTVGWNLTPRTSIFCNYFVIKDVFSRFGHELSPPTTQSLSMGIQNDHPLGHRSNVQFQFQARELWQAQDLHQFDFLPGVNYTYQLNERNILFLNTLLQMRGGDYFVAPTRELDPFYTLGYVGKKGSWTFTANDTLVTNFRSPPFSGSIPKQGNVTMIADFELSRPVFKKYPELVAFVRSEPIWNWSSHKAPGLSGFDFRLYGGVRLALGKPASYGSVEKLRKQILEENDANDKQEDPKINRLPGEQQ